MLKPTKRKAFNFLRSYFDVFNELKDDKDKLDFLTTILNKQFLNEDPKDLPFIVKLCYESQRHSIETSVKGWLRVNKTDVMFGPTTNLTTNPTTNPTSNPPSNPKEEEEEEKEKVEEEVKEEEDNNTAMPQKFSFYNSLINYGFDKNLINDWLKVRKTKKATNTQTAFNSFIKEIELRNCNLNEILEFIVSKNWSGFKWQWYDKENNPNNSENGKQQFENSGTKKQFRFSTADALETLARQNS